MNKNHCLILRLVTRKKKIGNTWNYKYIKEIEI